MTKRIVFSVAALLLVACAALAPFHYVSGQSSHGNRSGSGGSGTVTSVATTSPITGGTFTTTGTIACATCTTNAAALTSNAVVLGAGSQATQVSTGITTNGASELDLGVSGTNGVLGFNGSTSGKATFTAPSTAGTSTNPVVMTNVITGPTGSVSAPTYGWNSAGGYGMFFGNGTIIAQASAAIAAFSSAGNNGMRLGPSSGVQWVLSGSPDTGTADTGLYRQAAGVVSAGNGTSSDESALFRWGGACKPTSGATMNASGTPVAFCTWNLPASAKTWSWQCSGTYTTSTATDTFAVGMNASQNPTSETGNAIIYSTLTGTSTAGSATQTTSGNQNILTGASVSNVTSIPFSTSGTIQASATAGTFALTGTLTGTSPSGTVNVGTTCILY
jgi:hypothetical protein